MSNSVDVLINLKENISEECFQDIINITEDIFLNERGDIIDSLSKALTGKTVEQHAKDGAKKLFNVVKDKVMKSSPIKNTIGKSQLEKAQSDLEKAETKYNNARQHQKNNRVQREEAKFYNKEANKRAKKVAEIKRKFGLS